MTGRVVRAVTAVAAGIAFYTMSGRLEVGAGVALAVLIIRWLASRGSTRTSRVTAAEPRSEPVVNEPVAWTGHSPSRRVRVRQDGDTDE